MNADMIALWRTLAPDACLSTAEISNGIGVCAQAIRKRVKDGKMPPPAFIGGKSHSDVNGWHSNGTRGRPMTIQSRWRVRDILRWLD